VFLDVLQGKGFAQPNPNPMFPNPPGLLRLEPHSEGLRERIWWGASTNATAEWAAKQGMNLQSSTLKIDESGKPFHVQQAEQIRLYRDAWKAAGHTHDPRVSVSRSIFALVDDRDRAYFGRGNEGEDKVGYLHGTERAIFGRSFAAEPDALIKQLKGDEAIAEADTLLLTVPNQLGVDYNAHVIEAILKHVAPGRIRSTQPPPFKTAVRPSVSIGVWLTIFSSCLCDQTSCSSGAMLRSPTSTDEMPASLSAWSIFISSMKSSL
jgi:alkanesulfonate monooxygenase SsuD/methylene tetrahydromethanopterin reductase-like flavin-dependent oxidoreductase (luciferase family)